MSVRREESHTSSSDSQKQVNWVHNLPRKSIHKARSGILALKAGLNLRRPRDTPASPDDTNLERREASSVSTQEDLSFGIALYRTQVPWSSSGDEPSVDILMRTASFHPLVNIASAPEVLMSRRESIEDARRGRDVLFGHHVSISLCRLSFSTHSIATRPLTCGFRGPRTWRLGRTMGPLLITKGRSVLFEKLTEPS